MEFSFPLFFQYHFWWEDITDFQEEWMYAMQEPNINVFLEAFRASRKTTIVKWWVVWLICYKKTKYTVWQSFENDASAWSVRDVAKMLMKPSIVRDYWCLFPIKTKKADLAKTSLSNFETTNGIKIQSRSSWQTLRGANDYNIEDEQTERPDVLVLDDIDVLRSVMNERVIDKNEHKILNETMGAMDPLNRKIVFLGNTIYEDWVVPRFYKRYKNKSTWRCFRQPLFDENNNNVRSSVFNESVVQQLMDDGDVTFSQNYLLRPYAGNGIIKRTWLVYTKKMSSYDKIVIGVDPASSTKELSDWFAIVITWWSDGHKDVLGAYNLKGTEKEKDEVLKFLYNLYKSTWASIINFESVNAYSYLSDDLKAMWVAVNNVNPHKDKVTRVLEKETEFKKGIVRFVEDAPWIPELIAQLLLFPNGKHDDLVDWLILSISENAKPFIVF